MSAVLDLTPAEREQAFARRVDQLTPRIAPIRAPGERPLAIVVGGQIAAGKSTVQGLIHAALGPDRVASYDSDENIRVHPVTSSHHLAREEWAKGWIQGFSRRDYRTGAVYVATNDADSASSLIDRCQGLRDSGEGFGEAELGDTLDIHDAFYHEAPATAQVLESEGFVDDVYVVNRDGYVVYENHRDAAGNWEREPAVGQAIVDERGRPPTPGTRAQFGGTVGRLLHGRASLPPLEADVRRALAEAVRREAARPQPRPDARVFGPGDRIDARLALIAQRGTDPATWHAHRLNSEGMTRAGSSPVARVSSTAAGAAREAKGHVQEL
jgi:hypothetical protein